MSKGGKEVEMPKPEDYFPLIQKQMDTNRIDQITPWGGINYSYENTPQTWGQWSAANPASQSEGYWQNDNIGRDTGPMWVPGTNTGGQAGYDDYLANFDKGQQSVESFLSPELQSMFDKQFQPDAYNQYSDDYMSRYNELLQPGRDRQLDRFQQSQKDRGLPEGGEVYGDNYRTTVGDPNSRQDTMAAAMAAKSAENARLQDFNRLMFATGSTGVQHPMVDVMGPANMAMNANITNEQIDAQGSGNLWNTVAGLGSAYVTGGMMGDDPFWMKDLIT